jgi:hypothetical protein
MILLYTFKTINAALEAEQALKNAQRSCRVIPVPRALGTSCNYAITLEAGEDTALKFSISGVAYEKVFRCTGKAGKEGYEEIDTGLN